ncbi:hypothetical protein A245_31558, partial [Pseudomonas syringae pv. actinidiae ICMP 19096]
MSSAVQCLVSLHVKIRVVLQVAHDNAMYGVTLLRIILSVARSAPAAFDQHQRRRAFVGADLSAKWWFKRR